VRPPGFRHEEVSAEEGDQPDNREQSEAHLPDLLRVVEFGHLHRQRPLNQKTNSWIARKSITAIREGRKLKREPWV
jgi:hypothetical protein